ncbi:MAG: hypothetical protein WCJ19_03450 [bacterium]
MNNFNTGDYPRTTTTKKKSKSELLKKVSGVFLVLFLLFVLPVIINVSLSSQDIRNKAAVTGDNSSTIALSEQSSNQGMIDFLWTVYPFLLGFLFIIWVGLIFAYIGFKFNDKKNKL